MQLLLVVLALVFQYALCCNLEEKNLVKWANKRIMSLGNCSALSANAKPVRYKVPNVKLILYHNDEHEMLADFLQYHTYVFGFKSIVVIDQDSQSESVCRTLALFQQCGLEVVTTRSSFLLKGDTLTKIMRKYNNTLLIPLDTDELIFPLDRELSQTVSVHRDKLWSAFKALPIDGRKYKFHSYMNGMPNVSVCANSLAHGEPEFRRVIQSQLYYLGHHAGSRTKTFFHSHGFIYTDDGNHYGEVVNDKHRVNVDPDVAAHYDRYFYTAHAQMVHFPVGGYRGAKNKYVRASSHMGFTGDTNCSTPGRVGGQYCVPCKLFINGTDHGAKYYTDSCRAPPRAVPNFDVSEWFEKNTMSMLRLVEMDSV